jgi:HK97 family phage portal protein
MAKWFRNPFRQKKMSSLELFKEIFGGRDTYAGKTVTVQTAVEVAVVFACCRVLADGVAQVPLKIFQQNDRTRLPAKEHPLYFVLYRKPNSWQTSFEYRETIMFHLALCNNHFSFKNVVGGKVVELIPFEPGRMCVKQLPDYSLSYEYTAVNGAKQTFPQESIWHIRGPSWNSWMGMEAVAIARNAIGLAMAMEEQQSSLFKQGARPSGLLSVEGKLGPEKFKELKKWLEDNHEGASNASKTMIMDSAAKFTAMTLSSEDAQTVESRKHQVEDICRVWRVMPIMIGQADKAATYASSENMFLAHVVHCLAPWYERLEESIDVNLISESDFKKGIYSKFIEEGLLRGDLKATSQFLRELTGAGIMTRNEAREKLDMNPLPGLDEPLTPGNMMTKPDPKKPGDKPNQDNPEEEEDET